MPSHPDRVFAAAERQGRPGRRTFLGHLAALPFAPALACAATLSPAGESPDRQRIRAVLLSATTIVGGTSLGHAADALAELFGEVQRLLLINFASLPQDRDAYAERMQRDFGRIVSGIHVDSLHRAARPEAPGMIRDAEAVFVSGGNTFLLLRELYDRYVVELLRERVLGGMPYAGSSAGSNLAGLVIGTTNDFPLVDIPTRRSLGILPAVFNPHHPDPADEKDFGSRQWKIRQYASYHPHEPVVGVTDPGYLRISGDAISLEGPDALAIIQFGDRSLRVEPGARGNLSSALAELSSKPAASS